MRPVVVAYRADWPDRAAALTASLRDRLGPRAERIEHIGSTSIPGMAAKDILDMQVSVAGLAEAAGAFDEPLAGLGFERVPYESDHIPAGRGDDPQRWRKRLWSRRGPLGDVNLHVRRSGSPNERLALLFRDWFRAHPDAIAGYAAFKVALSAAVPDIEDYTDIKDPVVDVVIAAAEEWAAAAGWRA
ncbi:MAG TPA: GrpB family protein [Streptosporangiaceae bacterium]